MPEANEPDAVPEAPRDPQPDYEIGSGRVQPPQREGSK